MSQEKIVRDVVRFALVAVTKRVEEGFECRDILLGHLEAREDASEVRAVISVVEQADVPASAKLLEKRHERAGAFGKLEPAQPFVYNFGAPAADHVPNVQFCRLVSGQINRRVATGIEHRGNLCRVLA